MKTFRTFLVLFCGLAVLWAAGCGDKKKGKFTEEQMRTIPLANRYELPTASGGMVMALAGETITYDEVLKAVEPQLRPKAAQVDQRMFIDASVPLLREVVRTKAADILLYAQARKKAPTNVEEQLEKAIDQEMNRFVAGYGNNYALAEAKIRQMGMDWRTFREYQKKLIMTHSYMSSKLNETARFTHSEMLAYYDKVRDDQFCQSGTLEFSAIDLLPGQLTAEQIGQAVTPEVAAMELARSLAGRARAGEDFAELARIHSHGPLARSGGKWLPVTIGANSLPAPYHVLETEALLMEEGQISEPIVSDDHIFVLKLERKELGGCKSFAEVQPLIERQLQFERRGREYDKFVSELIQQADLVEMERFVQFCALMAYTQWKAG